MTTRSSCAVGYLAAALAFPAAAQTKKAPAASGSTVQITAKTPPPATPAWGKGIQPISRESYYNAVACGKQKGSQPACVFPDAGLCSNSDFSLRLFTPYKQVAYEVWAAVQHGQAPPTPNYAAAQQTRVTIGVDPAPGAKNPITALTIQRGGRTIPPATQSLDGGGGGRFIFDFAPFAPTEPITLVMTGKVRTIDCRVGVPVLKALR